MRRPGAWLTFLGTAIVVLRLTGTGELSPPSSYSFEGLAAWADARDPVVTGFALVRLGSELAAWYLLLVSILDVTADLVRVRWVDVLADALALTAVRRLIQTGLGAGLTVLVNPSAGEPTTSHPPHSTEDLVGAGSGPVLQESTGTATMRPLDGPGAAGTARMAPVPGPGAAPEPEPAGGAVPATWRVEHGDSFWSMAAEILETAWGRHPSDHEIDPFWRSLVDANRHRLVTADPDLVLPGQVFEVPAVPDGD